MSSPSSQRPPVRIITVSREYGAGGRDVALALGQALGWRVLDRDLVSLVAEKLELGEEVMARLDEHAPGLLVRLSSMLLVAMPEQPVPVAPIPSIDLDHAAVVTRQVIEEAVQSPPLIIVGHGAQVLLQDRPDAFHVRLAGPLHNRVERLCARYGWEPAYAEAQARRLDRERREYVQRYYHRHVGDMLLYDLQVNTGRLSIALATDLIRQAVEQFG